MGNRFGRNQKRKMRADLERWQEAHRRECELASWLREKGRRDKETVERVAKVLGEHFIALEPKTLMARELIGYLRLPRVGDSIFDMDVSPDTCESVEMAIEELEANWMELRADKLTGKQFVLLKSPGGDVGYALSRTALLLNGADANRLADEVARAMAPVLADSFRKYMRGA